MTIKSGTDIVGAVHTRTASRDYQGISLVTSSENLERFWVCETLTPPA